MRVTIKSQEFDKRDKAMLWMKDRYAEYPDGSIVSSCFAEDPDHIITYVIVDLDKLKPTKKKLIKIS